jgi:hypothetical protein
MITVKLTTKELECVINALQEYVSDLRMEIVDTDSAAYKDALKNEDATLEAVLAKLRAHGQAKGKA